MSTLQQFLRGAAKTSYSNASSGLIAVTVQAAIDELDLSIDGAIADIADIRTLTGTVDGDTDLGTFTGSTIADSSTVKAALQALETAHEEVDANANDLITLSGVAENATDLGTFTGTTIPDSSTNKGALQALETAHEETDTNTDDLVTLSGVAENSTDLGTFTGTTIPDSSTIKASLQSLETAHENLASTASLSEWQNSVIDFITDNTAVPPTEVSGDRYLLDTAGGAPNAAWDGASAGDIVEFNGTSWVATSPTTGMTVSVDDETTSVRQYGGSTWDQKYYESTTASTGLTKVGFDIRLDTSSAGAGLGFSAGVLSVNVDDSTIEVATDTLQVKADGINDTHIDFGTGANQVSAADIPIADAGTLITATEVEGALAENRTAIDAIEDNTITSTNGSISVSGTVGGDDQVVETVFSTAGAANRSIEASALASTTNGEGASMVGVEDAAGNWTSTNVEGVLVEVDSRLDALESGGTLDWQIKTAAHTTADGEKLLVDTSSGAVTITLPLSPTAGDEVFIRDAKRTSETNAITVARNGESIGGVAEDMTIQINGIQAHLVYVDGTHGWSVYAA